MSAEDEEVVASENDTTETVVHTPDESVEESTETPQVEHTEYEKKQYERAKLAEAEAKRFKAEAKLLKVKLEAAEEAKQQPTNAQPPSPDPDELRLIARGLSDEEIEQAKVVSRGKSIPLTEALKDPMFQSFQKDFKEQEKKAKAKLGASKGSGQTEEHSFKSGQTEEDHKELWKETIGRK